MQGGKEAVRSNAILHRLIVEAIAEVAPSVGRDLIGLVTSREAVDDLLKLHDVIDLVIPRGSNSLVGGWVGGWAAGWGSGEHVNEQVCKGTHPVWLGHPDVMQRAREWVRLSYNCSLRTDRLAAHT